MTARYSQDREESGAAGVVPRATRPGSSLHRCDERCVCPDHGLQLLYAPAIDDHACQDITCKYAHGFNEVRMQELFELLTTQRVPDEFDLAWGRRSWGGSLGREIETVDVNPELL